MKIILTFKTPDVVEYALEYLDEEQREKAEAAIAKYVKHGEYASIEIDIDSGEARALRVA